MGRGPVRCFVLGLSRAFAAAAVLVWRACSPGVSAAGLARWYMSAAVLLGAVSWRWAVQPAVHRAAAALAELACRPLRLATQNARQRPHKCAYTRPKAAAVACRKAKKSAKIKKIRRKNRLQKTVEEYYIISHT